MQEGWICPRCGRVNAPWLPNCTYEVNQHSNMNANTSEWTPIRDFMVKPHITGDRPTLTESEGEE